MLENSDQAFVEVIKKLKAQLKDVLPEERSAPLEDLLENLFRGTADPNLQREAIRYALEVIRENKAAETALFNLLSESPEVTKKYRSGFSILAGKPSPIPPGEPVCCPVDPTHLKTRLGRQGQRCPQHNVLLVPAKLVENKD